MSSLHPSPRIGVEERRSVHELYEMVERWDLVEIEYDDRILLLP
jgi:hypothetical protein